MHCSKGEALTPFESNRLTSIHVGKEILARQVTNVSRELAKWGMNKIGKLPPTATALYEL